MFLTMLLLLHTLLPLNGKFKDITGKLITFYIKILYSYPNYFFRKLGAYSIKILDILNNGINFTLANLMVIEPLRLLDKKYDETSKFTLFTYDNNKLLDHIYLFAALYSALLLEDEIKIPGKKIIIVSITSEDKTFYIHKNIIIDENTTISDYLDKIKNSIQSFYESGYPLTAFNIIQVKL